MSSGLPRQCERLREWLPEYAEGTLARRLRAQVQRHLGQCARCSAEVADLRTVIGAVRAVSSEEPPENLVPRVRRAVHQQAPAPAGVRQFWARLAVPVALLTGLVAVSFALRQPQPREAFVPGVGAIQESKKPALAAAARVEQANRLGLVKPDKEIVFKPAPEAFSAQPGGAPAPATPAPALEAKQLPPSPPAVSGGVHGPARLPTYGPPEPYLGRRAGGRGGRGAGGFRGGGGPPPRQGCAAEEQTQIPEGAEAAVEPSGEVGRSLARAPIEARMRGSEKREGLAGAADRAVASESVGPPFSATAVLAKGGQGQVIALRVVAKKPLESIVLKLGGEPPQNLLWQGDPSQPVWIPLSGDKLGPGPAAIAVTLASSGGARDYVLFIPLLARLGESAPTAPVVRYDRTPLRSVLADFSALTGLVILAEMPTDIGISGDVPRAAPEAALQRLAADNGLLVHREGDLAFTLTHRR